MKLRLHSGLAVAFFLSVLAVLPGFAAEEPLPTAPSNLDFEQGKPGEMPPGWFMPLHPQKDGYTATIVTEEPEGGRQAALLALEGDRKGDQVFGTMMTSFDAAPYRGKRIRFRAAVRVEVPTPQDKVGLWLRVDREGGARGFFDNMGRRPITSTDWKTYEIVGEVAQDAESINMGLLLAGSGRAWIDSVSFETLSAEPAVGIEPARPLTDRGLDNLVAFTRLLGYVRFFHPSDQAAAADWDNLALAGVQIAEKAASPEELARSLEDFFRPVAPTVRVYPTAGPKPAAPKLEGTEAVHWEHVGVKLEDRPNIYSSKRVSTPRPGGPVAPKPDEPFVADLGGGVSARIPLAVYKDAQGTLPRVPQETRPPAPKKPEGFVPSGDDRATRLAGVTLAWNVFQHFYPYFDVVQTDWPAELRKALNSAATDTDGQAFVFTLRRLMTALHDGHGNAYRANQDMSAYGVLPVLWDWVEGQLVVTEVAAGTEGIRRGDVVLTMDGKPAREVIATQKEMIPGATDAWRTFRALQRMLVGKRDEPVRIEGRHADGAAFTSTLQRSLSAEVPGPQETRPEKIAEVRPGIFYVDISRIEDADFEAALDRLAAAKGIVFDLRGYPNGSTVIISHLTDKPVSSARWTVPVVTRPDRKEWGWDVSSWDVQPKQPRLKGKAVFMTDGRAISYAETYMGIIGNYKLAEIVGAPTAGTNGNVNPFTLPGGYTLSWTGMRVLKHDGSRHHGIGILPTLPASRTLKGVAEGRDEVLERAIETASGGTG